MGAMSKGDGAEERKAEEKNNGAAHAAKHGAEHAPAPAATQAKEGKATLKGLAAKKKGKEGKVAIAVNRKVGL